MVSKAREDLPEPLKPVMTTSLSRGMFRVRFLRLCSRGIFARSIEERLQVAGVEIDPVRRSAQAHALAGSFFSLLDWWIDKGMKADPKEMDDLFHRMACSGLD